jgi:hypothetical protein
MPKYVPTDVLLPSLFMLFFLFPNHEEEIYEIYETTRLLVYTKYIASIPDASPLPFNERPTHKKTAKNKLDFCKTR